MTRVYARHARLFWHSKGGSASARSELENAKFRSLKRKFDSLVAKEQWQQKFPLFNVCLSLYYFSILCQKRLANEKSNQVLPSVVIIILEFASRSLHRAATAASIATTIAVPLRNSAAEISSKKFRWVKSWRKGQNRYASCNGSSSSWRLSLGCYSIEIQFQFISSDGFRRRVESKVVKLSFSSFICAIKGGGSDNGGEIKSIADRLIEFTAFNIAHSNRQLVYNFDTHSHHSLTPSPALPDYWPSDSSAMILVSFE